MAKRPKHTSDEILKKIEEIVDAAVDEMGDTETSISVSLKDYIAYGSSEEFRKKLTDLYTPFWKRVEVFYYRGEGHGGESIATFSISLYSV